MRYFEFDGRYVEDILRGKKWVIVRFGRKLNFKEGDIVFIYVGGYVFGKVVIERVESKIVGEFMDEDVFLDGFFSREELIRVFKEYYKYVNDNFFVYVIVFWFIEKFDRFVMSFDYVYEGNLLVEIVEKVFKYFDFLEEDRKLIELFFRMGSLRKVVYRFGGLNKRYLIREVLRRVYEELKKKGIMGLKF